MVKIKTGDFMNLFFVCVKIFFARILDVTIGTIRGNVMLHEKTFLAVFLAFVETMIWFMVAREALRIDISSILIPISYSLGYASGTLIGSFISSKFIPGIFMVQAIVDENKTQVLKELKAKGYLVSVIEMTNNFDGEPRIMIYLQVNRKTLHRVEKIIRRCDNDAFIAVSETKKVQNGYVK